MALRLEDIRDRMAERAQRAWQDIAFVDEFHDQLIGYVTEEMIDES